MSNLRAVQSKWEQPRIIMVNTEADLEQVYAALNGRPFQFFDPMPHAIEELYDIAYPHEKDLPEPKKSNYKEFKNHYEWPKGCFVFFPWSQRVVRFPAKDELRALRTSRNRNLITADEQKKLYQATVLVVGLSVGSSIIEALVATGIGSKFVLADMDIIGPTNLNRVRAPYHDVGVNKTDAVAMRMSEIDPYLEFKLYHDGLNKKNLLEILNVHKPDIIIDEMDQLDLKILIRKEAKARRTAVLSAADDGDDTLLDIERYDLDPNYPLYHGLIPADVLEYLQTSPNIPRQQLGMLIGKYFVGSDHIPLRMFQSLGEVGKTLPSWPQLGGAATQSGVAVAYACRKILLKLPVRQGRFVIGPDQILGPELDDPQYKTQLQIFRQQLNSVALHQPDTE